MLKHLPLGKKGFIMKILTKFSAVLLFISTVLVLITGALLELVKSYYPAIIGFITQGRFMNLKTKNSEKEISIA